MHSFSARNLRLQRGAFQLSIDQLELRPGSCVGLVGPNGAGKTTLLDILGGRLACPGAGLFLGPVPAEAFGFERAVAIGTVPDHLPGIPEVSVRDHLALRSRVFPWWDDEYAERLIQKLEIPRDTALKALSKGTAAKVAFVSVEAFRPPVLLLDEPTSGLDPLVRRELREVLVEALRERPSRLVLFSTHLVEDLEAVVDRVLVIRAGQILADRDVPLAGSREQRRAILDECMDLLARHTSSRAS